MKYAFLVLDYDGMYCNEKLEDNGVQPTVYMIQENMVTKAQNIAEYSVGVFYKNEMSDECVGDIFERLLDENGVKWMELGTIDLTYGERLNEYISEKVIHQII